MNNNYNKEITEIKVLKTNKVAIHYGKQIEVYNLPEFNEIINKRIKKTQRENERREILIYLVLLITLFILSMKLIQIFG
tara:strand:- start:12578 stop:12814 length:237 start_codon:yes stop_codon:yes gene_type:complete